MKRSRVSMWVGLSVFLAWGGVAIGQTPLGTDFTYQGQVQLAGSPLNAVADFRFSLWSAISGGTQIGAVVEATGALVVDGLFTVPLDFGVDAFNGDSRWLEISVRSPAGSGAFTSLSPRQALTASPYSLQTRGIFVGSNGRAGIGTRTPELDLVVARRRALSASATLGVKSSALFPPFEPAEQWLYLESNSEGSTNSIRQNDGSDLVIGLEQGDLGGPFIEQLRIRDSGTSKSDKGSNLVPDRVEIDTNAEEGLFFNRNSGSNVVLAGPQGNVGVGADNPQARLHILEGGTEPLLSATTLGTGEGARIAIANPGNSNPALQVQSNGTVSALQVAGGFELNDGPFRVTGAGVGTNTAAFIHQTNDGNTDGLSTVIDHPLTNNDPNAILIVTLNPSPGGQSLGQVTVPVGVTYSGGRWRIYVTDNDSAMNPNTAFNVLVIKP